MLVVGLTGGIGSGKSAVAALFQALGAAVIDTDVIAHELTAPGQPAVEQIRARFGAHYVTAQGALDRARMRELVFADAAAKRDLEAILHPRIREQAAARVAQAGTPYAILVVPLLAETGGWPGLIDRVLVVDCEESLQTERTRRRSGLSADQVQAIMARQATRAQRLALADDVIDNSGPVEALEEQVRRLHARYLSLAQA
ncbi:MAG TPA: dephospho-CoA kinase [Burkholderiales bacterium]|nr:dephospho-CoA kinase [Burkholderiales bacterium]